MKKLFVAITFAALSFASPALACEQCLHGKDHKAHHAAHMGHKGHAVAQAHKGHNGPAMPVMNKTKRTRADIDLYKVGIKMHHAMDVALIGTADADFLRTMIPHHQGAIDMADVVLKHGSNADVAQFAKLIRRVQSGEIAWMNRLLTRMNQPLTAKTGNGAMEKSADTPAKKELLHIHHAMHQAMDIKLTGKADVDFVRGMIPHHQGAIDMAVWILKHGRNDDVKELARDIIKAQQAEIAWMKRWLKNNAKDQ